MANSKITEKIDLPIINCLVIDIFYFSLHVTLFLNLVFSISFLLLAGVDYVGISRNLDFSPGVTMQTFRVVILDDLGQPVLEGTKKFELVLRMPINAALGEPSKATIFINDSVSDCE